MNERRTTSRVGQVKEITSLSNPIVKDIRALSQKKNRDESGTFLAEGLKLVIDAFEQGWTIHTLIYAKAARGKQAVEEVAAEEPAAEHTTVVTAELLKKYRQAAIRCDEAKIVSLEDQDKSWHPGGEELQIDAAIIPAIAAKKAKNSPLLGNASVLIFPSLEAGNIAYKITERLAGYTAWGPLLQGFKKPIHDLSRGCSVDDIICVSSIAAMQSLKNKD